MTPQHLTHFIVLSASPTIHGMKVIHINHITVAMLVSIHLRLLFVDGVERSMHGVMLTHLFALHQLILNDIIFIFILGGRGVDQSQSLDEAIQHIIGNIDVSRSMKAQNRFIVRQLGMDHIVLHRQSRVELLRDLLCGCIRFLVFARNRQLRLRQVAHPFAVHHKLVIGCSLLFRVQDHPNRHLLRLQLAERIHRHALLRVAAVEIERQSRKHQAI
mmetsp:Transcript_46440/g.74430  ORF Transcript_46440/g.74430 Transcript_46440/m.74430 type:complete len:216 (-) Transcript_46440:28-675(-)